MNTTFFTKINLRLMFCVAFINDLHLTFAGKADFFLHLTLSEQDIFTCYACGNFYHESISFRNLTLISSVKYISTYVII